MVFSCPIGPPGENVRVRVQHRASAIWCRAGSHPPQRFCRSPQTACILATTVVLPSCFSTLADQAPGRLEARPVGQETLRRIGGPEHRSEPIIPARLRHHLAEPGVIPSSATPEGRFAELAFPARGSTDREHESAVPVLDPRLGSPDRSPSETILEVQ